MTTAATVRFFIRHKVSLEYTRLSAGESLPWFEWFKRPVSLFKLLRRTTRSCAIKSIENGDALYGKQKRTFHLFASYEDGTKRKRRYRNDKRFKIAAIGKTIIILIHDFNNETCMYKRIMIVNLWHFGNLANTYKRFHLRLRTDFSSLIQIQQHLQTKK